MAEIAAGALVAEQVISTTVEGGAVAGYAIAKDTMPLKATFTQIAKAPEHDPAQLTRSHHTITVIGNKAYIFGGFVSDGELASTDIHVVTLPSSQHTDAQYACHPAVPHVDDSELPAPRTRHGACAKDHQIVVFGGCDASSNPIDEDQCLWLFDSVTFRWQRMANINASLGDENAPGKRYDHSMSLYNDTHLLLHGGRTSPESATSTDTWLFDFSSQGWSKLPDAPSAANSVAFLHDTLYLISSSDSLSSNVHYLRLTPSEKDPKSPSCTPWQTVSFPTNPLAPGPEPRTGAGLVPVTTGYGRQYLLYLFGLRASVSAEASDALSNREKEKATTAPYHSDLWTFQTASAPTLPQKSILEGLKPAAVKDTIRHKLGYDSGGHSWSEVEVLAPEDMSEHEGKLHPGPRGFFAVDVLQDGRGVVIWGGLNAGGEREGDGWIVRVQ